MTECKIITNNKGTIHPRDLVEGQMYEVDGDFQYINTYITDYRSTIKYGSHLYNNILVVVEFPVTELNLLLNQKIHIHKKCFLFYRNNTLLSFETDLYENKKDKVTDVDVSSELNELFS